MEAGCSTPMLLNRFRIGTMEDFFKCTPIINNAVVCYALRWERHGNFRTLFDGKNRQH